MTRTKPAEAGSDEVGTYVKDTPGATRTTTIAPLDKRSAEKLTAEIKAWAGTLWLKLRQAHDGQAWKPLGYTSWADYVRVEFDMSRSYAYRLISHANAVAELEAAAGIGPGEEVSPVGDTLPEGSTRDLDVPAATVSVAEAVADLDEDATDGDRAAIVAAAVDAVRKAKKKAAQPPTLGFRRKHLDQLDVLVTNLEGAIIAFDRIKTGADFDPSLTSEEAARIASELSTPVRALNQIISALKERTS